MKLLVYVAFFVFLVGGNEYASADTFYLTFHNTGSEDVYYSTAIRGAKLFGWGTGEPVAGTRCRRDHPGKCMPARMSRLFSHSRNEAVISNSKTETPGPESHGSKVGMLRKAMFLITGLKTKVGQAGNWMGLLRCLWLSL
ncbi:hypothetical protein HML84_21080 [Alcanivorax sp. IO_7]|nr:hypothetical protein HML84_21080 [Alcanivorax sp. IO_7]